MFGLSKIDKIKQAYPILEFIQSSGVELKRNGQGYVGKCPFHADGSPSFRVTPEKGLFNCFGCKKGGDVINFYQYSKGISNKEAIEALWQQHKGSVGVSGKIEGVQAAKNLKDVVRLYRTSFEQSRKAQAYLEARGLVSKELWRKVGVGYCEGSAVKTAVEGSSEERLRLKERGILNDKGNECFYKCVTIPIYSETGSVVGLYGRSIEGDRQMYLKGPRSGVFNSVVASTYSRVIVCESILDAMSLMELGQLNTIAVYGVQGWTKDHDKFFATHRFQEVIFCLDNDEAGRGAALDFCEKLKAFPLTVSIVELPKGIKDANEYLSKGGTREDFEALLEQRLVLLECELGKSLLEEGPGEGLKKASGAEAELAPVPTVEEEQQGTTSLSKQRAEPVSQVPAALKAGEYSIGGLSYKVRGLKVNNDASMKAVVTVGNGKCQHTDRLDLVLAKARTSFAQAAADKLLLQSAKIEDDLQELLSSLEEEQLNKKAETSSLSTRMSPAERRAALAFLKRKDLLKRILKDIAELGYVGQEREKMLLYLSALSRLTDHPIHISIRSTSSSGKSALMEKVSALIPPESVEVFSRISSQSLYYMDSIKHKLLVIDEKGGALEGAELALRSLMSRQQLTLATVQRDGRTGDSQTVTKELHGPCVVWDSSTENPTEDNQNRVFELWLDESREQTRRVHELQRQAYSLEGTQRKDKIEAIKKLHHNAQRLLKSYPVVIPFSKQLSFPDHSTRTHRDHLRLLSLIALVTLLHQAQRPVKWSAEGKEYLEATMEDYEIAFKLTEEIFHNAYCHVPKDSRSLLQKVYNELKASPESKTMDLKELTFSRRQVREWIHWSESKTRRCLGELVRMEYVQSVHSNGGRGGYRYRLLALPHELEMPMDGFTQPEKLRNVTALSVSGTKLSGSRQKPVTTL